MISSHGVTVPPGVVVTDSVSPASSANSGVEDVHRDQTIVRCLAGMSHEGAEVLTLG
jgi:phosphoenolpyruvate synthase/pyruvate phosphate dikinase